MSDDTTFMAGFVSGFRFAASWFGFQLWDESSGTKPTPTELWAKLEPHPLERQRLIIKNSCLYHRADFCNWLCQRSYDVRFENVEQVYVYAQLAVDVADHVLAEVHSLNELKAWAWAHLGNAYKLTGNYQNGSSAFDKVAEVLDRGNLDIARKAHVLYLQASFETTRGKQTAALQIIDKAIALYKSVDDNHHVGVCLTVKALALWRGGDDEAGLRTLNEAIERIDQKRDLRIFLSARHNLANILEQKGEWQAALAQLTEIYPLYRDLGDRLNVARLHYLEARLMLRIGFRVGAESSFLKARDAFLDQGIGIDAAQVSTDLALLYLGEGRTWKVRDLAVETVAIMHAEDMDMEAQAGLLLFQRAAQNDTVTEQLVKKLAESLRRSDRADKDRL